MGAWVCWWAMAVCPAVSRGVRVCTVTASMAVAGQCRSCAGLLDTETPLQIDGSLQTRTGTTPYSSAPRAFAALQVAVVPALTGLLVTPLVLYKLFAPQIKDTPEAPKVCGWLRVSNAHATAFKCCISTQGWEGGGCTGAGLGLFETLLRLRPARSGL